METASLTGRLLVATPALADGNFAHSVVLLLHHDAQGAVGVVLNRPSEVPVERIVPGWRPWAAMPPVVFLGGPVQPEAVIALARSDRAQGTRAVLPGVSVVQASPQPRGADDVSAVRLFAGYAGWDSGQVEGEIAAGGWFLIAGTPDDAFNEQPAQLWRSVLARKGGLFTTISEDPSLN